MAYRVVKSENINGKKNIYTYEGTGTKPEGDHIAENSKLTDLSQGKVYYYDPTKADGSKWQPLKSSEGGSGGGLPADFPAEGIANANKFLGFDASGDYAALTAPSGGGAEKFVVTLTVDDSGEETVWTADKTIAEIVEAKEAEQVVVASLPADSVQGLPTEIGLISVINEVDETQVLFSGFILIEGSNIAVTVFGAVDDGNDVWLVASNDIESIPSYSSANNGKVLGVDDGDLAWVDSNAPLIVTLTADQNTGNFVGDRTNKEVYDAFAAGQAVVLSASVGSSEFKLAVQYATFDGTDYEFAFIDSTSVKNTLSGGEKDYVTASFT